jgi:succinate dehydrogenase/fumarate reductase-like Fe-S protein
MDVTIAINGQPVDEKDLEKYEIPERAKFIIKGALKRLNAELEENISYRK